MHLKEVVLTNESYQKEANWLKWKGALGFAVLINKSRGSKHPASDTLFTRPAASRHVGWSSFPSGERWSCFLAGANHTTVTGTVCIVTRPLCFVGTGCAAGRCALGPCLQSGL